MRAIDFARLGDGQFCLTDSQGGALGWQFDRKLCMTYAMRA